MSEIMRPLSFESLVSHALREYRAAGSVFGVPAGAFYKSDPRRRMSVFGRRIATPVGPAAGPHSQLAQNIICAWLCGGRFIELKTVQRIDGGALRAAVPRPCINAADEGYNAEWSTELTVEGALCEYVKAWVAIHALAGEFGLDTDIVFNMSVGYDLEGITSPKVDGFIRGMADASRTESFTECIAWLRDNVNIFERLSESDIAGIPAAVSESATLSTMHGCPPEETERIARHLMDEKKLHTYIKCNPTLLGYKAARGLLDAAGYGYVDFGGHHFQNDMRYPAAAAMLKRLMARAESACLSFGVKLTNTFPVRARGLLPGDEMYMSGRALFPLSVAVAAKLSREFGGRLPISYSGGADAFNIEALVSAGVVPVTAATTLLKPGGYMRLAQLAAVAAPIMPAERRGADAAALARLAAAAPRMPRYARQPRPQAGRKTALPLGLFDCFTAPCRSGGCPIGQRIPEYLQLMCEGRHDEAFSVIAADNAAPSVTGSICPHACQSKCTRLDCDDPLGIRAAKLAACEAAQRRFTAALAPPALKTDRRVAVVGAGPAGIAAALYLRRAGVDVTVFERREKPFGIVQYVIPSFRIGDEAIQRDFEMALGMGVRFCFGQNVADINALRARYDYVVLAVGAWLEGAPAVERGQELLLGALDFLERSKARNYGVRPGKRVAVIGGGDVAMDCARTAARARGVEEVCVVYRRTRAYMPASHEEISLALADGVRLVELCAPRSYDGAALVCERMALGDFDESNRRAVAGTGEETSLAFDAVICAVGARVDTGLFEAAGIAADARGKPVLSAMCETSIAGVYAIGDCRAGPATVVAGMADAKKAAASICAKLGISAGFDTAHAAPGGRVPRAHRGVLQAALPMPGECGRCLGCEARCEVCCEVCPNRANVSVRIEGFRDAAQILHIDRLCNECGNCGVFCPRAGEPYRDKLTLFATEADLEDSSNRGFTRLRDGRYMVRLEDGGVRTCGLDDGVIPPRVAAVIRAAGEQYAHLCDDFCTRSAAW